MATRSASSMLKAVMYISRLQLLLDPVVILGELGFGELEAFCFSRKSWNSFRIAVVRVPALGQLGIALLPK